MWETATSIRPSIRPAYKWQVPCVVVNVTLWTGRMWHSSWTPIVYSPGFDFFLHQMYDILPR